MFVENENQEENTQQEVHVLDQKVVLGNDENEGSLAFLFDEPKPVAPIEGAEKTGDKVAEGEKGQNKPAETPNAFDDIDDKSTSENPDEDAKLIEKLKAQGYNVEKVETPDEDQLFNEKLKTYEESINLSKQFIALPDEKIVEEKVKHDLLTKYRSTGRAHLIGTAEFELEAEAELDNYNSNETLRKIYADNIRREVKEGNLAQANANKEKLVKEQESKIEKKVLEQKTNLKNSFNEIFDKGMLGVKFEKEDIQKAFDYVTSGNFSKDTRNNPNSLAELALYHLNRDKFAENGGASYGEGVRDAVKDLKGEQKSTSHIVAAMQSNASRGQGGNNQSWGTVLDPNSEELKGKEII